MLYEIWSLGHKPFEDMSANEVCIATQYVQHAVSRYITMSLDN